MAAADNDILLPFSLPNICRRRVTAAFDGGQVSSGGGVFFWPRPTSALPDRHAGQGDLGRSQPSPDITHSMTDILRERLFAIACGYPDVDDSVIAP
jgi:hypothetical protein